MFRQRYGRGDLLRQSLVLGSTALTVVVMHVQMQAMQGIWTAVLPALTAYGVMLVVWAVLLFWRKSRG
ncbi:MAG: hypothetical protein PF630_10185 [Gammaproteobacteria bacterium]|nr:hypothetical protein [Gammaproteobacteria bacterium]